jgi:hypothetical protein
VIDDWTSYRVADFIPFTADVYFRLLERVGETFWPSHVLTMGGGLTILVLVLYGRARMAGLLLAGVWTWVGVTFLMQRYAQLNWAGEYFGWGFLVQAALLVLLALTGRGLASAGRPAGMAGWMGLLLVLAGVAAYPVIAPLAGFGWFQAETFGIHADPTAVATIGFVLLALDGAWRWLVFIVPALWCLISVLTLQALDAPWSQVLVFILALGTIAMLWQSVENAVRTRMVRSGPRR